MGVVWLAEDTRLGRKVALKFLPPEAARDAVRRQRFEQEARAAAALSHPGIATVHELAETEAQTFIVFEYVPGSTLRSRVVPGGLPPEELLDIAGDIAAALAAAHSAGVVHRDLKPENVMRTPAGDCKVLDFGLARLSATTTPGSATETRSHLTGAGMVVGTVGYMAPEQLEGKEVDFRCDIFSFGTLVYELATGVHPFQSGSSASTVAAIMKDEPPPLTQRNQLQPPELERIVRKCLRKRRKERYQSTLDLAVDLANLKHDSGERPSSVSAVTAAYPMTEDDSLLRRMFSSFAASPRRWWELHQLFVILVYSPLYIYLIWQAGQDIFRLPGPEPARSTVRDFGTKVFIGVILLFSVTVVVRLYLVCLAVILPKQRLGTEVQRLQPVLRGVYFLLAGIAAMSGLGVLNVVGPETGLLAAAIAALCLGTFLAAAWIEPAIERAAFPQEFAEADQDRGRRTLIYRTAAVHVPYMLLLMAPVATGKLALDKVMAGIGFQATASQLGLFVYSAVMTIGSVALLINAVQIVKEGNAGLRVFRRWFPACLAIDLVGTGAWVWMAFDGRTPAVIALGVTAVLLALPFAQLRMAKQVLCESGELKEEERPAAAIVAGTLRWWWAQQVTAVLIMVPVFMVMMAPFGIPELKSMLFAFPNLVFFFELFSVSLNISIRVALALVALVSASRLAEWAERMRLWIRITGWTIVAGLVLTVGALQDKGQSNAIKAVIAGALATIVAVSLLIVEPAVERSAFPSSTEIPVVAPSQRPSKLRLWWWWYNLSACVAVPLLVYLAWLGWHEALVFWGKSVFIAVVVGANLNVAARVTFLCFAFFEMPDVAWFLRRYGVWQRIGMFIFTAGLGILAVPLSEAHVGMAATLAATAIVGVAGSELVEPAIARGAFPETSNHKDRGS